jgi:hypothetical protein
VLADVPPSVVNGDLELTLRDHSVEKDYHGMFANSVRL